MSKLEIVARLEELPLSADPLDRLHELHEARNMIEWYIDAAVTECRTNAQQDHPDVVNGETRVATTAKPISWTRIGDALGMSRQSAWQRFRFND